MKTKINKLPIETLSKPNQTPRADTRPTGIQAKSLRCRPAALSGRGLASAWLALGLAVATLCSSVIQPANAAPAISITNLPAFGAYGVMQGFVSGVDFSAFKVAPYIQIEGLGWWTKPTFATPTVPINPDGSFSANVTTGGLDAWATIFCAALVPTNYTPPQAGASRRVPAELNAAAIDCVESYGRTISFANRMWAVKTAPWPVGPGSNRFSEDPADVWVDDAGLHLTIRQKDGLWWSSEVILLEHLGYGTYVFKTASRTDVLDTNAVFGLFTWDAYGDDESSGESHHREFDFEDASWGRTGDPNSQAVVQQWYVPGNRHRYYLPDLSADSRLTRIFTWRPGSIRFLALAGDQSPTNFPAGAVIDDWTYSHAPGSGHYVPPAGRERIHCNLYLFNSSAPPSNGQPIEVVISDFSFTPLARPRITAIERIGNDVRLSFTSELGSHYAVQGQTNVAAATWVTLPGTIAGNGGIAQTTVTNAFSQPRQFYRLEEVR